MTTYDIKVKDITVMERVTPEQLSQSMKEVELIVWLKGGDIEDVEYSINTRQQ
jgi:hypothetical protein